MFPFFELMERLSRDQHEALAVAFGLSTGPTPNPVLVGMAVLGLLTEAADEQPLACVVDDAHWLDTASARAMAFVARRLLAEKLALVFATRELGNALVGLPQLQIEPLGRRDARALLESVLPAPLDERVLERLVAETHGNPLALVELPRGLSSTELAGGYGFPQAATVSASIEESFMRRLATLPRNARRLLLLAAADPLGDPALVWHAAELLGIYAVDTGELEQFVTLSPRVVFRHPLVRSAVYGAASLNERREVHSALAEATDPEVDPDRRAWHRAAATATPDEEVAAELERAAGRAQARGGFVAAAAFLERAVVLSPEPARRAQRALDAAQAKFQAGALDDAVSLLQAAESGTAADDLVRAHARLLRGEIAFVSTRGSDATALLLAGARDLEAVDSKLARTTYLEALLAATFAGRLAGVTGVVEVSKAALTGSPMPEAPGPSDFLLQGLAVQFTEGYAAGAPLLKEALSAFRRDAVLSPEEARWLFFASYVALHMWDDESWAVLNTRQLDLIRQTGATSALPVVLSNRSRVFAFMGEMRTATHLEEECQAVTQAIGIAPLHNGRLCLAALCGREPEFSKLIRTMVDEAVTRGEGLAVTNTEFLGGTLYNGLGRYEEALAAVLPAERVYHEAPAIWALAELIEAAVRCGQPERARHALERIQETTRAAGTDYALGSEARCCALLSDGDDAESFYREAITRLQQTSVRVVLARVHLSYGEWLRREHRRLDARTELRTAHELFIDFGMDGYAERARIELEATGARARKRTVETLDQLTPQERQAARLAAEGHTNREIATRLFISTRTVEHHLLGAFRKLDVQSRTQLKTHVW